MADQIASRHKREIASSTVRAWIRAIATAVLPVEFRRWIRTQQRRYRLQWTRVGTVEFGSLRLVTPISPVFGLDRGFTVHRHYIERFLSAHASDISGRVLEIGDDFYTRKFGSDGVTKSDVLHVVEGNPLATIVADLACADNIPSDTFDCIIFTQTLTHIFDARAALGHLYRILKPGGVLLTTKTGIKKIGRREGVDDWGTYWHFTGQGVGRLFQETWPAPDVRVGVYGNILATIAALHGLSAKELRQEELDYSDPDYEVIITVRAVKDGVSGK